MTFDTGFFFLIATLAVVSAIMVVTRRNPVQSVLSLIVNLFCLAVLYLILQAQFIAIIQILVYAGAIMVLFLFVVMLLNLGDEKRLEERRTVKKYVAVALSAVMLLLILSAVGVSLRSPGETGLRGPDEIGTVEFIGSALFSTYLLPFELTSIVLLAAMVGVIVLAKKKFE